MKIIIIVFSLLIIRDSFAQDCTTLARSKAEPITRSPDQFMNYGPRKPASWDINKMKPNQAKVEVWIRNLLTGFTGAKVGYSNEYSLDHVNGGQAVEDFYKETGIKGFCGSTTRFWAYYCYEGNNKIQTEGEAGSFVYVTLNNVFSYNAFDGLLTGVGLAIVNGKPVFEVLEKSHTEGRIDYYDRRKRMNYNDTINTSKEEIIIIRNSEKPVFIPITRKEYLQQMLKDAEVSRVKQKEMMTDIYNKGEKEFEESMKAYKLDKTYTAEKEAKRRKWFEEDQEKRDKLIKKIDPDVDASLDVIREYLQKSDEEWLGRTVRSIYSELPFTALGVRGYFKFLDDFKESKEDYTRSEIAYLNPDYFNKTLSNDVPQLIMVELVKNGYWYMYKLAEKVKQSGALASLATMMNPGKSTSIAATPEIKSTYSLQYLPKLTALPPLKVPAGMKPSAVPTAINYNSTAGAAKINFETPPMSPKLKELALLASEESYKNYIQQLNTDISNAIIPDEKRKADEYIKNKKLSQSKDISNTAFAAWLQNAPKGSLYLFSKALNANPSDALTANNFSAFLLMGGLPEKAIPILEYWNKKKPNEPTLLSNLGNAYYRLGDVEKAMNYLQQCVQRDTFNATANKILCLMYLKKGDTKKAEEHGTRSITTSHDEQVISILRQVNNQIRPGIIMSRSNKKEFPLLKRVRLPEMPSKLDQMDQFKIDLDAEKKSVDATIADINSKLPDDGNSITSKIVKSAFGAPMSDLRMKAQRIFFDGLELYEKQSISEADAYKYRLKIIAAPFNQKVAAINKKYNAQLGKLEGGEAGDEDKIAALELAQCKEVNAEKQNYLQELSTLVNEYAQRMEYISRKFCMDYANWWGFWMPSDTRYFPLIERQYLEDVSSILSEYKTLTASQCEFDKEPLPEKDGKLKLWEDDYCAIFKGKIGWGPANISWTCNSWGVEAGEGLLLELEMNYADDGSFSDFTLGGGLGTELDLGGNKIVALEAGASVKEFIKVGQNKATGKWEVKDFGVKAEATLEGSIGPATNEIKILEVSSAVKAGYEAGGVIALILHLK